MRRINLLIVALICTFMLLVGSNASAENRWIEETVSTNLIQIMRDEVRDRIYLADSGNNEIAIIDSREERVVERIALPDKPLDMALSQNNTWIAVVLAGNRLVIINLNNLKIKELRVSKEIETTIRSVAFDYANRIFVIDNFDLGKGGWVYLLSSDGKKVINKFGVGPNLDQIRMQGLIKTDLKGTVLYVAMVDYSPGKLTKIDVSDPKKPVFLAEDSHVDIEGNMRDFVISPRYDEIYAVSGGAYGVQVLDSNSIRLIEIVWTDGYPLGVDVNRQGNRVYSTSDASNNLFVMDATPSARGIINIYPLDFKVSGHYPQPRGIAIDRFGEKAFVIHGNYYYGPMRVQVVDVVE